MRSMLRREIEAFSSADGDISAIVTISSNSAGSSLFNAALRMNENIAAFPEASIKIGEGDYGRFFSEAETKSESKLSQNNKKILSDLVKRIRHGNH